MDAEIWLMLDPVGDQALAVSTRAFDVIAKPKSRVLARNCVALFLDPGGVVRRIETLHTKRRGLLTNLRLWMGRPVPARFVFETIEAPLEDIRTMVMDCATYARQNGRAMQGNWWLHSAPLDEIQAELEAASSLRGLYARMRFPPERECMALL